MTKRVLGTGAAGDLPVEQGSETVEVAPEPTPEPEEIEPEAEEEDQ